MLWEWSPHDGVSALIRKARGLATPRSAMGGPNKWLPVKLEEHLHHKLTLLLLRLEFPASNYKK